MQLHYDVRQETSWWQYIFTHNPFYVTSAVLTLYGLHLSFGSNIDYSTGWLHMQLFAGYILLLAAAGVLVVRLGQVWEDARTLFLLVLLLFVALSVSFDRVCLDNEWNGLQFLLVSLIFCLLLCEALLWILKICLPWSYRIVLYLQFTILFLYPPWLGHLSLEDRLDAMGWYAMSFPTIIAGSVLLLLPAAYRRERGLTENGTPWSWPWYPWTIFVVLGIGIIIRAVTITFSFDPSKGFGSGFQLYFLIPLLLAIFLVIAENCLGLWSPRKLWRLIATPLGLLALALPGRPQTAVQTRYLDLLQETVGSPIQITAVLLLCYFCYLLLRRVRTAEWGILVSLAVLSVADHNTVDLRSFVWVNPIPAMIGVLLVVGSAIFRRNTSRLCVATLGITMLVTYALADTSFVTGRGYAPIHLAFVSVVLAGLVYDDSLGRLFRRVAGPILCGVAIFSLLAYRHLFPDIAVPWHALVAICLGIAAALCWLRNRQFRDLLSLVLCLGIAVTHLAEHFVGITVNLTLLRGKRWFIGGALFFVAGMLVSLLKGGQFRRLYQALKQWENALEKPPHDF